MRISDWSSDVCSSDLVAGYNQTLVAALHEVTDAVQAAHSLDAQIASATQARDAARAALEIADQRYEAGLGTQIDVLSAQRPLLQLEQQLAALTARRHAPTAAPHRGRQTRENGNRRSVQQ